MVTHATLSYVQLHYMPGNPQSVPLANATTTTYLWNSNISDACASVCATDPKKMSSTSLFHSKEDVGATHELQTKKQHLHI